MYILVIQLNMRTAACDIKQSAAFNSVF